MESKDSHFLRALKANKRLQKSGGDIAAIPRKGQYMALSLNQQRLWQIEQAFPGLPMHTMRSAFRMTGSLDIACLERSIKAIGARHEVLQTAFVANNGEGTAEVHSGIPLVIRRHDLSTFDPTQHNQLIEQYANALVQKNFDLGNAPLMRIALLQLSKTEDNSENGVFILMIATHHIVTDRWSTSLFLRELAQLYKAEVQGTTPELPVLDIQYADFSVWQRERIHSVSGAKSGLDYWTQKLAAAKEAVLPIEKAGFGRGSYQGGILFQPIEHEVSEELKSVATSNGTSLFSVLLAAYKVLLWQYSGQTDITVCSPVSGRYHPKTKKLIGYFSNMVLLRSVFDEASSDSLSLKDVLETVSRSSVEAFENQEIPVQHLVKTLQLPDRLVSQAMFALQNVPVLPDSLGDVKLEPVYLPEQTSNFALFMSIRVETNGSLVAVLRYQKAFFTNKGVQEIMQRYTDLLALFSSDSTRKLSDLPRYKIPEIKAVKNTIQSRALSEEEKVLAEHWKQVLGPVEVTLNDSFFVLGGGSLAMVELCQVLQEHHQQDVSVDLIFQNPTLSGMANALNSAASTTKEIDDQTFSAFEARFKQQTQLKSRRQQRSQSRNTSKGSRVGSRVPSKPITETNNSQI